MDMSFRRLSVFSASIRLGGETKIGRSLVPKEKMKWRRDKMLYRYHARRWNRSKMSSSSKRSVMLFRLSDLLSVLQNCVKLLSQTVDFIPNNNLHC